MSWTATLGDMLLHHSPFLLHFYSSSFHPVSAPSCIFRLTVMIWSSLLPPSTPPSSLTVIFCSRYVFSAVRQEASSGRPPNLGILCLTAQGACGYNTVGWHPTGVFIPKWKQSSYLKGKSRFVIASQTVDTIVLLIWLHHWLDNFSKPRPLQ